MSFRREVGHGGEDAPGDRLARVPAGGQAGPSAVRLPADLGAQSVSFFGDSGNDVEAVKQFAAHIQAIPRVAAAIGREDVAEDSWAIAVGLKDIHQASERIFRELLPALLAASPESPEAEHLLHAIGEEYRHILYHITTTRFFGYLVGSTPGPEER